jgi:inosine-uridine nucleoside N-ribohydrolase
MLISRYWGLLPVRPLRKDYSRLLTDITDTADTWQPQVALHAVATLEAGNLNCIPVFSGSTWPLINTPHRLHTWELMHGKLPWQGAFAPENTTYEAEGNDPTSGNPNRIVKAAFKEGFPRGKPDNVTSAANFMVEMVRKYPSQVSIYSAGALTNVALAVRLNPQFASLAKELVIMGGYVDVNMLQVTGSMTLAELQGDVRQCSATTAYGLSIVNFFWMNCCRNFVMEISLSKTKH